MRKKTWFISKFGKVTMQTTVLECHSDVSHEVQNCLHVNYNTHNPEVLSNVFESKVTCILPQGVSLYIMAILSTMENFNIEIMVLVTVHHFGIW